MIRQGVGSEWTDAKKLGGDRGEPVAAEPHRAG